MFRSFMTEDDTVNVRNEEDFKQTRDEIILSFDIFLLFIICMFNTVLKKAIGVDLRPYNMRNPDL